MSFGRPYWYEMKEFQHEKVKYLLAGKSSVHYAVYDQEGNDHYFGGPFNYVKEMYRHDRKPLIFGRKDKVFDFYDFEGNATGLFGAPFFQTEKVKDISGMPLLEGWKSGEGRMIFTLEGEAFLGYDSAATLTSLKDLMDESEYLQAKEVGAILHETIRENQEVVERIELWSTFAQTVVEAKSAGTLPKILRTLKNELMNHPDRYLEMMRCIA